VANPDSERVKAWRAANPDRYREYQRALMRKRRERKRVEAPEEPKTNGGVLAPATETT
jgi:hypothetical protein